MSHRIRLVASVGISTLLAGVLLASPAAAHDGPDEGEAAFVMADWMLLSFLVFFLTALVVFVVTLKRGLMRDPEGPAKHHLLTIDEPDYYTPQWARESLDA